MMIKKNKETNVYRENSRSAINNRKQPHAFKIDPSDCTHKHVVNQVHCWRVCGATDAMTQGMDKGPLLLS